MPILKWGLNCFQGMTVDAELRWCLTLPCWESCKNQPDPFSKSYGRCSVVLTVVPKKGLSRTLPGLWTVQDLAWTKPCLNQLKPFNPWNVYRNLTVISNSNPNHQQVNTLNRFSNMISRSSIFHWAFWGFPCSSARCSRYSGPREPVEPVWHWNHYHTTVQRLLKIWKDFIVT